MWQEFKTFIMRGNAIDLAVGVVIGGAFGTIVSSLVDDVIMPPIGLLTGGVDFSNQFIVLKEGATAAAPYASLAAAKEAGAVVLGYGVFINSLITFLIVAAAIFILVRSINRLHAKPAEEPAAPTTKGCPFCATDIPVAATRCPHCTSQL